MSGAHIFKNVADHLVPEDPNDRLMVLSKVAVSQKLGWKHPLPILAILYFAAKEISLHPLSMGLSPHCRHPNESGSFTVPSQDSVGSRFSVLTLLSHFHSLPFNTCF